MKKINVEMPARDIVSALVKDDNIFDEMPALRVGDNVVVDVERLYHLGSLILKFSFGAYQIKGYGIDTSDKNNKPEFELQRIA